MAFPVALGLIGKTLAGLGKKKGIGAAIGGLFKKKAGGTAVGNALRGAGSLLKKKEGGTLVGNALRGLGGVPGALSIGSAALAGRQGRRQQKEAEAMMRNLKDPGFQIPEEYAQNLAQAEQLARVGMPAEQYNLAATNIQRGTQAGLRQLGRMSNPFAGIAGLARTQTDALANLDAANAAARRQNIMGAMGARSQLAQAKLAQQQYGQQRFFEQMNQAQALQGAGMQNVAGGLAGLGNIGMALSMYGGQARPGSSVSESPNPMSPVQMSRLSTYQRPNLNTSSPTSFGNINAVGANQPMNLGSLRKTGRFSGFGFSG